MVKNRVVFEDIYPTQILHRNAKLDSLSRSLEPAQYGRAAENVLIHGTGGVGKTASARWMLRDLRQRADVNSALIECSGQIRNGILYEAIEKYPIVDATDTGRTGR